MMKLLKLITAAALIISAAAALYMLRTARPELFRKKTLMEKEHPVCALGVAEPPGAVPAGKAGIRNVYVNWKTSFPEAEVRAIRASGAIPMITWEPYLDDIARDALLPDINAGKYDAYISSFAGRSQGGRLFLRFGHEPNSDWYGWSGAKTSPVLYVKAFRRVRELFLKGNKETAFIFSVNSKDVPGTGWNRFENYYPGDDYADVIGIDAFNWGTGAKGWQSWATPRQMLTPAYLRALKAFPSKPVFLTETASCGQGGDKAQWITELLDSIGKPFPAVKAVVWFNYDKECDWTLSSDGMRRNFYGACGSGRFECSDKSLEWIFTGKP